MPQDAFTLRYLCEELNSIFAGGKINRITQPSNDELILTVYTGKQTEKLLLNVNPSAPRISIINEEKDSPLTAPNFCMLMRKHLLSATIDNVSLIGFDRIVRIDFTASKEFVDAVQKTVYVELMGRYSNIILTENGRILGGNRGINMFDNGVRPLIVNHLYVFPPVQDKLLPSDTALIDYLSAFNGEDLSAYLCAGIQGLAQSTAKEIVNGFFDTVDEKIKQIDGEKLFDYLNYHIYKMPKNPCVLIDNGTVKDVFCYPYKVSQGEFKFFDNLWQAEEYYFHERDKVKKFTSKRERLSSIIATATKKVKKRLTAITAKEKDAFSAEENKIKGELLLANIYRIKNGQEICALENYYDGTTVEIVLDSRLSVSKNAENYYKKYNKQKRTLTALAPQKAQAEAELNYLSGVVDEINLSENIEELNLIQNELESVGIMQEQKNVHRKKSAESFCRTYEIDGFRVRAGRNNTENDKLTFTAHSNDMWLHAKDYHSSHIVIESGGVKIPERVILTACEITAYYSKGRDGGKTEVVYTEKKNVKKPSGAKPGYVTYDNFRSITVMPEKHTEFLING